MTTPPKKGKKRPPYFMVEGRMIAEKSSQAAPSGVSSSKTNSRNVVLFEQLNSTSIGPASLRIDFPYTDTEEELNS
eukprot:CAMPEP_0170504726 /NCGR_PEP_ID=MMETSP0208-20121228/48791_1 /TAXON_ID=197538 /ORGANISM="Strombidium inclinatum, Strain S3" /LENGTH=75 /DNA_ID=CAMNT_0010785151 /DNA_START=394 /DNA_END=621 /DNA_ORIENTATION=+